VDILKALAIILVVISHFHIYLFSNKEYFELLDPYMAYFGLAIFFFLSGYTLYINNNQFKTMVDVINFYKKRLFRIFPLYWAALIVFMALYVAWSGFRSFYLEPASYYDFTWTGLIVHLFGLQTLTGKFIGGMWFIGTIIAYYLVYPLIVYVSKDLKHLLAAVAALLVLLVVLYTPLHLIKDGHVPLFLSIFAGGIIACKISLFDNRDYRKYFIILPIVFAVTLLIDILLFDKGSFVLNEHFSVVKYGAYFVTRNILLLATAMLSYLCIRPLVAGLDGRVKGFFTKLSYGSYATYLFHMQLFPVIVLAMDYLFKSTVVADLTLIVLGLPLSLIAGYYLQKYYDAIARDTAKIMFPKKAAS
jgi:peptidoglycan/LPS O-acetylase OafA/YrhL